MVLGGGIDPRNPDVKYHQPDEYLLLRSARFMKVDPRTLVPTPPPELVQACNEWWVMAALVYENAEQEIQKDLEERRR